MENNTRKSFESFLEANFNDYINVKGISVSDPFREKIIHFNINVKLLLDDAVKSLLDYDGQIPQRLLTELLIYTNDVLDIVKELTNYNYRQDESKSFLKRNEVINRMDKFVKTAYSGRYDPTSSSNLLAIYSAVKSFTSKKDDNLFSEQKNNIDKLAKGMKDVSDKAKADLKQINEMTDTLRKRMTEKGTEEYSMIFHEQAFKNSHFERRKKFPFIHFGSAERWFLLGIIFIVGLIYFLFIYPINEQVINYPYLITKISITVILIFLITFSFKQFSVNKHLHTLNKHRENALNTYKLFSKSVGDEEPSTRYAIILEVAKAIFEHNITGFISSKDKDMSSPSWIEFTKFFTTTKQN